MNFHDLGAQYAALQEKIDAQIADVLATGQFILGPKVRELETRLADFVGRKHCITCANGTDALSLVLLAWGIGAGDAVFTSDFTFFASAGCASAAGATPVPVDIDLGTFNLSPAALEAAILRIQAEGKLCPKVIITVDLFGLPANYPAIEAIAQKYGLRILEDAAQGFGGSFNGKRAGAFGHAATTSFFPAKPLGCYGDGGAIFTDDDAEATLLYSLRSQGCSPSDKYDNRFIGMNSRLDALQAGILLPKLEALEAYELSALDQSAALYTSLLGDVVTTPAIPGGYTSSWAQYSILVPHAAMRDGLQQHLKSQGIPSMVYYPRGIHQQSAYAHLQLPDTLFPNTLDASGRILSLPMHPYLAAEEAAMVVSAVQAFIKMHV